MSMILSTLCIRVSKSAAPNRLKFPTTVSMLLAVFALLAFTQRAAHGQAVSGSVTAPRPLSLLNNAGTSAPSTVSESLTDAKLSKPDDAILDNSGNLYIADYGIGAVEKVTGLASSNPQIVVIAGGGSATPTVSTQLATAVKLNPYALAFDSTGNLYIGDGNGYVEEVAVTGLSGSSPQIGVIAGGGTTAPSSTTAIAPTNAKLAPSDVAVDSAGNVYVADSQSKFLEEITGISGNSPQLIAVACNGGTTPGGSAISALTANCNPYAAEVGPDGNVYIADSSNHYVEQYNPTGKTITVVAGAVNSSNSPSTVPASALSVGISPTNVSFDAAGNLYIADGSGNSVEEVTGLSGPSPQLFVVAGTGTSGSGPTGALEAATTVNLGAPYATPVDAAGNLYILDESNSGIDELGVAAQIPTTAVGAASPTQNVFVELTAASAISSISVPKAQNGAQEFTVGTVTGCTLGTTSNAINTICTVPITFNSQYPGVRTGALTLYSSGTTILGTVGLSGIGTGPLGVFSPGTASVVNAGSPGTPATALSGPYSAAVDASGDVYIADTNNSRIVEYSAAGVASVVNVGSPGGTVLTYPTGVAVDAAGDLYIADDGNSRIVEYSAAGAASVVSTGSLTAGSGCSPIPLCNPQGLAMDTAGDLYIADTGNKRIVEHSATGVTSVVNVGSPGGNPLKYPIGVAVDASGDVYIADTNNSRIVEYSATGVSSVVNVGSPGGTALSYPSGVVVDAAGDLYIADSNNGRIVEYSAAGVASVVPVGTALTYPIGVAVDGAGDLYTADYTNSRIVKLNQSQTATLNFGSLAVGDSSPQQTVALQNIGNTPLAFTTLAATTNFNLGGNTSTCTSTTSLTAGTTCDLGVEFAPTAAGSLSGTVNITDNSLNVATTVQQISLSGTGNALATTTTLSASSGGITAGQPVTFTAAVTSSYGIPSGTVSFLNGTTVIGTGTLNSSGVATFTTSTLVAGGDPAFTSTYAAQGNYLGSTSSLVSVTVSAVTPSYTMTANPSSLTIAAGATGSTTITFTPVGGYTGSVTLSCGTLPAFVKCAFTQGGTANSTVAMTGNDAAISVVLTISTNVATAMNVLPSILQTPTNRPATLLAAAKTPTPSQSPMNPILPALAFWGPGGLAGLAAFGRKRKLTKSQRGFLQLGLLLLLTGALAAGLSGCGGSSSTPATNTNTSVTPAGTSAVVITAAPTSGSAQTLNLSVTITG